MHPGTCECGFATEFSSDYERIILFIASTSADRYEYREILLTRG